MGEGNQVHGSSDVVVVAVTATLERSLAIVARCESFARAKSFDAVRLADLARECGASERRVRMAFQTVHGVPPTEHLRRVALDEVRERLADGDPARTSVTREAASRGFWHHGRFAAAYRLRFGENPSTTLRHGAGTSS